jgi:hypothetical protein
MFAVLVLWLYGLVVVATSRPAVSLLVLRALFRVGVCRAHGACSCLASCAVLLAIVCVRSAVPCTLCVVNCAVIVCTQLFGGCVALLCVNVAHGPCGCSEGMVVQYTECRGAGGEGVWALGGQGQARSRTSNASVLLHHSNLCRHTTSTTCIYICISNNLFSLTDTTTSASAILLQLVVCAAVLL